MSKSKVSPIWQVPSEDFSRIVKSCKTLREVVVYLGYSETRTGSLRTLKKRIEAENIDTSHMEIHRREIWKKSLTKQFPLEEILKQNSTYNRTNLKNRLIKEGFLEEKCDECGISSEWNGKSLSLQLDHKNGINDDNRIENLRLLCPNCHSQTANYAGKSKPKKPHRICSSCFKKITRHSKSGLCSICINKEISVSKRTVIRPSKEELITLISTLPFVQIARMYGVSDNAIRKWCRFYNLPYKKSELQALNKS